ncbi:hypothetical protein J6358_14910 [Burkholderia pseudomallei]|uniref:hypothetical protein n=1 Tax=Burkholderia pseudomallei TaxID=28450 RepID=UPI00193DA428|nr:hypothetical protein [Burkholderia pseudomallei]MBO7804380.1 hypothetical protein [Burkholderia pseudomallei]MBO7931028.1 hypothetical protein [Burkholderia pseudomallei]QRM22858.1 hypothetical protein JQX71_00440 [Burkholderia pseudomallei]
MKVDFERLVWTRRIPSDPIVWVSVNAIDSSWQHDKGRYVGRGGKGSQDDRYAHFGKWLASNLHRRIEIPEVGLTRGEVTFSNGRHRFAWFRDHGLVVLPVAVDPAIVEPFQARFATLRRVGQLHETKFSAYPGK